LRPFFVQFISKRIGIVASERSEWGFLFFSYFSSMIARGFRFGFNGQEKDDDGVLGDQLQTDCVEHHTSRPRKTEDLCGRGALGDENNVAGALYDAVNIASGIKSFSKAKGNILENGAGPVNTLDAAGSAGSVSKNVAGQAKKENDK